MGVSVDQKTLEKKLLLKRCYLITTIFQIGKEQGIHFFDYYINAWELNIDEATMELAQTLSDTQIQEVFKKYPARNHVVFRGNCYTFEDGTLTLKSSAEKIRAGIAETEKKHGQTACLQIDRCSP